MAPKKSPSGSLIGASLFFHLLPIVSLVAYTFVFAAFFMLCEQHKDKGEDHEVFLKKLSHRIKSDVRLYRNELIQALVNAQRSPEFEQLNHRALLQFERHMNCSSYRKLDDSDSWSFGNSIFFVASLISTIGYGNAVPKTTGGKILCFPCVVFGIPLFFYVIANWGYLFYDGVTAIWHTCHTTSKRRRLRPHPHRRAEDDWSLKNTYRSATPAPIANAAPRTAVPNATQNAITFERGPLAKYRVHRIGDSFSIGVVVALFVIWLLIFAAIYVAWEGWSYFNSLYFLFLSVTTIGLGDIVPESLHVKMWSFPVLLLGLSVLAMLTAAVQSNVETIYRTLWFLMQSNYQKYIPDSPDLTIGDTNKPLLSPHLAQPKSDISHIVSLLPWWQRFLHSTMFSKGRKEYLALRWAFLRSRKNQTCQTGDEGGDTPSGRKLSWSRPVQFGTNEKFPRPVKSVNFNDSYVEFAQPYELQVRNTMTKSPSADASSNMSFATAVSYFVQPQSATNVSLPNSEESFDGAPPCCFVTEGTYMVSPKRPQRPHEVP